MDNRVWPPGPHWYSGEAPAGGPSLPHPVSTLQTGLVYLSIPPLKDTWQSPHRRDTLGPLCQLHPTPAGPSPRCWGSLAFLAGGG